MHPGPYRAASKAGAFVTMLAFYDIYTKHGVLSRDPQYESIVVRGTVGGYAIKVHCTLKRDSGEDFVGFWLGLCDGEWNHYFEWPFSKKVTLIVTHVSNREKDIRLPVTPCGHLMTKKPAHGDCNIGMGSKYVNWKHIERNGFIVNKTLYMNYEFV
ncbi:hypothetical protein HPB51_012341 [Rhipicephalus microplus]|uniref:TRAF1-6 MATH domain-containing protein n=1 Tax=Rhipicephalus microplus TaxID=6941 RepID=A0A9J6DGE9_RHIMP|nr:hypothetical protein HPB51_012341 [Rhipicephalus microplus]